jgi:predicted dinucleotide-binding enzyme
MVADPLALGAAMAVLGERVTPVNVLAAAVAQAEIVVIATPDRRFARLPLACFGTGGKIVVDCWRILPEEVAEVADVIHLGRGPVQ